MTNTSATNKEIAATIINQMGGAGRIIAMVGVDMFIAIENGVQFRFKAKGKGGINIVKVVLNGNDLYDVTFGKVRAMKYTEISVSSDVFCSDLKSLFETTTGLYLSL